MFLHFAGHEVDPSKATLRSDGYFVVYAPWHPNAWGTCGLFYLHRLVVEVKLGRFLERSEHVHHKDGDRQNNSMGNLEILSSAEHAALHHSERNGDRPTWIICEVCGIQADKRDKKRFCSPECSAIGSRKVSDEELLRAFEINEGVALSRIAKSIGISDVAMKRRLGKLGIDTSKRSKVLGAQVAL